MDLNSDLGESLGAWRMGDDAAMLGIVSSANVACGFHAGDPAGILHTLRRAAERGVVVGAHVAYPDLAGFGRRNMDVASADLVADVIYQIGALKGLATAAGTTVRYVKPHGALYNTIAHDERQARDVIAAILAVDASLVLLGLAGSPLLQRDPAAGLGVPATPAALLLPAGAQGPAWLVTPNYQAIWRYNRADTYALAIGLLSDALKGLPAQRPCTTVMPFTSARSSPWNRTTMSRFSNTS